MSFVTGWLAAAGLAAASIPVIIHLLLRRRRKPMFWGAMALLLEATRRQRRRTQLEQVILLTIRCLFFALAGLALAQPLMQDITSTGRSRVVHLLIDDGIVSGVMDPDGQTALERHAAQAAKKLSSLVPGDRVTVTLASRPVRAIVEAPSSDMRSIGLVLDGLSSREGATDFTAALNLVAPRLQEPGLDHEIHLLGDFRAGSIQQDDLPNQINVVEGATLDIRVSPPTSLPRSNVQVESIEVARNPASTASSAGTGMIRVSVRLRRNGEMPSGRTTVRLEGDAIAALPPRMVEWTPGRAEAVVEFQARVGKGGGVVKAVLDHDALPADDQRFTTVDPPGPITVLLVDREDIHGGARLDQLGVSGWIERALDPVRESNVFDAAVRIDSTDPASLDARDLEDASVVFLARPDLLEPKKMEVLASYLGRGGVVVVIPPTKAVARPWASPMLEAMNVPWSVALEPEVMEEPRALSSRQPDSSLLKLLASELPSLAPSVRINRRLPIEGFADAEAVLLDSEGDAVILETGVGAGRLVFLAFAPVLEWTDLPVRPLMVPLVHEIVRRGSALAGRSMGGVVGESAPLVRSPAVVAIIDNDGTRLSRTSGDRFDIPEHSGAYQAVGSTDTNIETVVVNPAIDAAQVARVSREELADWLSNAGDFSYLNNEGELDTSDAQVLNGSDIAFILFMIAAALVLLETAAQRYFSRGAIRRASNPGVGASRSGIGSGGLEPTV